MTGARPYTAIGGSRGPSSLPSAVPGVESRRSPLRNVLGRVAGWTLVVVGVVLMPLPGPGTLIVVAGLRILVPYHRWAAASYDRVRDRAVAAARAGVATGPRIIGSVAGVGWIAMVTGIYLADASIPQVSLFGLTVGPSLPFHSTATIVGLVVSSLASAGATLYSVVRLRPDREPARALGT